MPSTGTAYGLAQHGSCDRRYDFERATESAFRLLRDLYARHKNWALAIAAYNCGDGRIYEAMRSQRATDYYHLRLPWKRNAMSSESWPSRQSWAIPGSTATTCPKGPAMPNSIWIG